MIEKFRNYLLEATVGVSTENRGHTFGKKSTLVAIEQGLVAEMSVLNYIMKKHEEDVVPICHVSATPVPIELGLLNYL